MVTDTAGSTTTVAVPVYLNNTPPRIDYLSVADGDRYPADRSTLLRLSATATDAEHAAADLAYSWRVYLHHNDHFHAEPVVEARDSRLVVSPVGCDGELYYYRIALTVTDPLGASTTQSRQIHPNCQPLDFGAGPLTALLDEDRVVLDWSLQRPDSVAQLELLRSTDQLRWELLEATVPAADGRYRFVDAAPARAINHYRIKYRTADGRYEYSNPAVVEYPARTAITLFPNPTDGEAVLTVLESTEELVRLSLYDAAGRRVLQRRWRSEPGQRFTRPLDLAALPAGVYFYRVYNGRREASGRLTVR